MTAPVGSSRAWAHNSDGRPIALPCAMRQVPPLPAGVEGKSGGKGGRSDPGRRVRDVGTVRLQCVPRDAERAEG